jgi:hypothetical protein
MLGALAAFVVAAALPFVFFRRALSIVASQFTMDLHFFVSELSPWILIVAGLLFFLPVAVSAGRDPDSRLYPRARGAYAGWGITLYLLGVLLATQVNQIARLTE